VVCLVARWRACCPTRKVLTMSSIWSHSSCEEVFPTIFILFPHINNCYRWFISVSLNEIYKNNTIILLHITSENGDRYVLAKSGLIPVHFDDVLCFFLSDTFYITLMGL
jgi:hypothetical protein